MEYKERHMDSAIEYVLYSWRVEAAIETPLMYNINWDNHHIIIYTNYPGKLIGMRESILKNLRNECTKHGRSLKSLKSMKLGVAFNK